MDPLHGVELRKRYGWALAALLGLIGFFLNLRPVPLSPGTELLFGGVPSLMAAVALGPLHGVLAAAIAAARTPWLWNHPWALLIFVAEAGVVGVLARRYGHRVLVADLLYWVALGVPLLFLTYYLLLGVRGSTAAVLFLKQPFNGLINALAAEAFLLIPVLRRILGLRRAPQLRSTLAVVVASAAIVPALGFGIWTGRREWDRNVAEARENAQIVAEAHASTVEQYVGLHVRAVRSTAEAAERRQELAPEQMQRLVSVMHEEFPGFSGVYAADAVGVSVAFHPEAAAGNRLVGSSFADREYVQRLRSTRETVVTDLIVGRGAAVGAAIAVAHPIILADTVAGFVAGALDLRALPTPRPAPRPGVRVRVADAEGGVLYDSDLGPRIGDRPVSVRDSVAFQAITAVGGTGTTTYRAGDARISAAMTAAQVFAGVSHIPELGWWVWVERPFANIQANVADSYVRLLSLLILVTLLALGISDILARYLAGPLLRMRETTAALAAGDLTARVGPLPAMVPVEVEELGRGFDEMASALAGHTDELEELGEIARSLASTLDADELLRRVTDAAVRLVRPDGCGIALLQPGGETLRAADYSLGLLAPTATREVPVDGSLVGWVSRTGMSTRIDDATTDARIHREHLDTSELGGVVCAPLLGRSGPLGALTCVRSRAAHPFNDRDLRLLERLARHAAIAVENAHLVAAERRRAAESEAIRVVARTVTAVQGLQQTLAVVTHEAATIVDAAGCTVALLRPGQGDLEVVSASGPTAFPVGTLLAAKGKLMEVPLRTGEPTVEDGVGHAASAPLRVGDETLGVLTATRPNEPFTSGDAALLAAFADHAAIALRNARLLEAAQAASRAKSDFIATMSHELRTPLNAVLGHLQLLEMEIHGPITPEQREAIGRIDAASRHLRGLIEEVLSFSRLEAGRPEVNLERTDLCSLVHEVAAVIEPLALQKELVFTAGACATPVVAETDADKVRQILINLAGNAVKFTERGEVRVGVRAEGSEVILEVTDTGPGIAEADLERLFQPFEQLQSGFSRSHEGTGLGLYLSWRYAELLGGRIDVRSEIGSGSTFALVLPCEPRGEAGAPEGDAIPVGVDERAV